MTAIAALVMASPAAATVYYDFSANFQEGNFVPPNLSFKLNTDDFISSDQTFTPAQVGLICGDAFVTCTSVTLSTDFFAGHDTVEINFLAGSNPQTAYYYFGPTAFGAIGGSRQDQGSFFNNATLSVAVPEPATWAMAIMGLGLVGGTLRSARRQRAATA
ncbi:PEPxxWA-CTERM sorting domain-containing protein [Phenylobacterium sp.]|uniref:PEPxxWA-CTERM sorting domain-containing protein n=1 Tax=Phenylobacterium sp. TaxID=1871053 RepID=UPI0025DEBAAA|nr:PEPxxWA-CTERM sorting domain-containing protein [Phenylobacterium sp.]